MSTEFVGNRQSSCHDDPGRVDIAFSKDRFLQGVLRQAQLNAGDLPVQRLKGMGFSEDVVAMALHASSGDERKALELCMSGCTFMHIATACGSDPRVPLVERVPQTNLRCFICGKQYLTAKSRDIHVKVCRRRFELREAKRPENQRRILLEPEDLPDGVDCLESFYAQKPELLQGDCDVGDICSTDDLTCQVPGELLPCEFCKRTFSPDRLSSHQKACLHKPKNETTTHAAKGNRGGGGNLPTTYAQPPLAAIKAYSDFCNQLERCTCCGRMFRPELLGTHRRHCQADSRRNNQFVPPARNSVSGSKQTVSVTRFPRSTHVTQVAPKSNEPPAPAGQPCQSSEELLEKEYISVVQDGCDSVLKAELEQRLPGAEFLGAYKVNNHPQKGVYEMLKASLMAERGGDPVERELWHGTTWATVPKILKQGFNRSFAGKHGTLLGIATYFSTDLAYSHRFCERRGGGTNGTKALLLSRVIVGRYCKGLPTDVEPPMMNDGSDDRYDCTVDNGEHPCIFAVFRDFQAIPLYLLEFRTPATTLSALQVARNQ